MTMLPMDPNLPPIVRGTDYGFPQMPRQGIFGRRPTFDVPADITAMANAPSRKPKFFGKNGMGWDIVGMLGDVLSDGPATFTQSRLSEHLRKQQQADTLAQYEAQQRIAAQYRKTQPHYWEANDGSLMGIGPDGQPQQVYKDPTPKPYMVTNPDGTISPYIFNSTTQQFQPVGVGGATGATPPMPVGKLTPYGGPQATPAGGFR